MNQLKETFSTCLFERTPVKIIFSSPRKKSLPYRRVTIRPLLHCGRPSWQAEYTYEKKAIHENIENEQILEFCIDFVLRDFKQINLFTEEEDVQILAAKPDRPRITRKPGTLKQENLEHNQAKQYIIPDGTPCDFLIRLGVMNEQGKVFPKHYAKFRQINRFLEILQDVFPHLPDTREKPLRIIDFGCGKAYLTFALYHYLNVMKSMNAEVIGLDLKEDVIAFCGQTAYDLGYTNLQFLMGDIADYTSDHADMVVTLHACDTATDYALINAVKWNTSVILSVPCCQHELFSQIKNDLHQPMFKHGIIKDRFTELLTDGLRGLKLEACGYDVAMIEFTSLEHTSKNIMIKAVKTKAANSKAAEEYEKLKAFYQVNPTIDCL
ncbi:SAM-dependent methyltransferase [Ihubacter massiliensis]|uniref:SAM-dependent methyltransferase n=1 Tax=Hominibacterium faecale TaxID=2839743 RepID=A0A9J6QWV6_9FIRM|nr:MULTISPECIES: SAM-dependent methyltransferase [Eubacteriales Family XIII. Incertae Sedis]MCC2864966.1 SAM-dependent methyltransferase [Anaerovorax odorimutans]MCO7120643.1 SAM-dependent methyltransferase [Ihubacter massiliensis]MCU7379944.1 SAM-dependent methyltransferase [Hominibacterium faecale]MDE8734901.1 SAM-dependent methyltransferase [Eubacteriales bacterium DFI.9.88]